MSASIQFYPMLSTQICSAQWRHPRMLHDGKRKIPMGRFARVEDVANLAIFLCSPAATYLTGGLYPVDGGAMTGSFGG